MKLTKKTLIYALISLIILLYLSFLSIDISERNSLPLISNTLKYISICCCFIIALLIGSDCINSCDKKLLQLGMFLTTISDLCLLILGKFTLGVAIFCIVQICYIIRFNVVSSYYYLKNLLLFLLGLFIIKIILRNLSINIENLYIVVVFYAVCLLISVFSSIKANRNNIYPNPNNNLIVIGLILFMLCDINVAIYNITNQIPSLNIPWLSYISNSLIWVFYLPSQLLLALSGLNFNKGNYSL